MMRARPPSSVATQIRPSPSDLERIDGVGGQTRGIRGIVPEYPDDGAVLLRKIEAAVVGAEPHVALQILGDGRDARRADRSANGRAEGELANHACRRVDHIGAAIVHAEPDPPVTALVNRLNAFCARAARIAPFDRNGLEPSAGRQFLEAARHRADPQGISTIEAQRHDAAIAERISSADDVVDVTGLAAACIELLEAAAHRCDPHPVIGGIGEGSHRLAAEPFRVGDRRAPSCAGSSG